MAAEPVETLSVPTSPASGCCARTAPRPIGAKAYFGTFGTSVFIQACTALQSILIARLLGPAGRGEFAAVVLWPTAFAGLGLFGAHMAMARRAGSMGAVASLTKTATLLSFGTSAITVGVCYLLLPSLLPATLAHLLPIATLFLAIIPMNQLATNLQSLDLGSGDFRLLNFSRAVLYPVFIAGLIVVWLSGSRDLAWVIVALLIGEGAMVLILVGARRGQFRSNQKCLSLARLLREGLPYGFVGLGDLFYQRADQMLLLWLLSARDLGLYVVALSAAGALSSIPFSIGMVSFTESAQAVPGTGFMRIASAFRRTLVISVLGGVVLALAIPILLPLIYGRAFADSVPAALMVVPGLVMAGLSQVLDQCLRGSGNPLAGMAGRIVAIGTMAISGYILSGLWGFLGIAVAFVAAQAAYLALLIAGVVRYYGDAEVFKFMPSIRDLREVLSRAGDYCRSLRR